MPFPVTIIALDLEEIFYFSLDGAGIDIRDRGVATLFPSSAAPETLLLVLVLFWVGGGNLVSRR